MRSIKTLSSSPRLSHYSPPALRRHSRVSRPGPAPTRQTGNQDACGRVSGLQAQVNYEHQEQARERTASALANRARRSGSRRRRAGDARQPAGARLLYAGGRLPLELLVMAIAAILALPGVALMAVALLWML